MKGNKMNKFLLVCIITYAPFAFAGNLTQDSELVRKCGACHGMDGNSPLPNVPNLAGQLRGYLLWQLLNEKEFKVHGRENEKMGALVDQLSEGDIRNLADYYSAQEPRSSASVESLGPDLISKGKLIYERTITGRMGISCGNCHGDNAEGAENRKVVGLEDFPRLAGQKRDYLMSRLSKYASREVGYGLLGMNIVASSLNEDEIKELAAYLSSLK
jgi:cytochrome c553